MCIRDDDRGARGIQADAQAGADTGRRRRSVDLVENVAQRRVAGNEIDGEGDAVGQHDLEIVARDKRNAVAVVEWREQRGTRQVQVETVLSANTGAAVQGFEQSLGTAVQRHSARDAATDQAADCAHHIQAQIAGKTGTGGGGECGRSGTGIDDRKTGLTGIDATGHKAGTCGLNRRDHVADRCRRAKIDLDLAAVTERESQVVGGDVHPAAVVQERERRAACQAKAREGGCIERIRMRAAGQSRELEAR